jgi:hypothetical protein
VSENEQLNGPTDDLVDEDTVLQTYTLEQFPEKLAVVRLGPGAEIPSWAESSSLFSVTATALETSIVCAMRSVPRKAAQAGPFTAFAVQGKLDFALTGVLSTLLMPLAAAEISIFTISTFDTDWILVPINDAERAAEAWRDSGHEVVVAVPVEPERPERPARDQSKPKQEKRSK